MVLQASRLACVREGRALFDELSMEVGAGEALWVKGRNGAGKTSLLRQLCGLTRPSAGSVSWCGDDIHRKHQTRADFHRSLLYLGHANNLKDELTGVENLLLGERLAGRALAVRAAATALAHVGLGRAAWRPAGRLSQGQRRRVSLARLHVTQAPPLWILDEPFTALDDVAADALHATLEQHLAHGGIIVYTTHQLRSLTAVRSHMLDLSARSAAAQPPPC